MSQTLTCHYLYTLLGTFKITDMTAKEFVKERYPKARAERQRTGSNTTFGETYWLIRDGRETMYMAEGKTESNAWVNAKKKILEREA